MRDWKAELNAYDAEVSVIAKALGIEVATFAKPTQVPSRVVSFGIAKRRDRAARRKVQGTPTASHQRAGRLRGERVDEDARQCFRSEISTSTVAGIIDKLLGNDFVEMSQSRETELTKRRLLGVARIPLKPNLSAPVPWSCVA